MSSWVIPESPTLWPSYTTKKQAETAGSFETPNIRIFFVILKQVSLSQTNKTTVIPYQIRKCLITLWAHTHTHTHRPNSLYHFSSKAVQQPISVSDYLINHHRFSPATALKASSTTPLLKNPKNTDSVFQCLEETGFSKAHIETIVTKYPKALSIQRKLKLFHDSGFSPSETVDIVFNNPWVLNWCTDDRLRKTVSSLRSILGSTAHIRTVLLKLGSWSFGGNTLMANIEYLHLTCRVSSDQIKTFLLSHPKIFVSSPKVARRVDEAGFDRGSRLFLPAIQIMIGLSRDNWDLKLRFFRVLGLSEDETSAMFRRAPQIFGLSVEKIKENIDIMVAYGKVDLSFVVKHPELIGYSGVRRVKPRLDVMEILEKRELIEKRPKLTSIITISRDRFLVKYVVPYSAVIPLHIVKKL